MTFADFCQVYEREYRPRIKENTWERKEHRVRTKIIPFFGRKRMCDITPSDIALWQNEMMSAR